RAGLLPPSAERGTDHARPAGGAGALSFQDRDRRRPGNRLRPDVSHPLECRNQGWIEADNPDTQQARRYAKGLPMFANTFPDRALIAETTAKMLLEIEAVHFRADQP